MFTVATQTIKSQFDLYFIIKAFLKFSLKFDIKIHTPRHHQQEQQERVRDHEGGLGSTKT